MNNHGGVDSVGWVGWGPCLGVKVANSQSENKGKVVQGVEQRLN